MSEEIKRKVTRKSDEELLSNYEAQQKRAAERVAKLKARIAKKEHERQFEVYKRVYEAMHGWLVNHNITDDLILKLDGKTALRKAIFDNIKQDS